MNARDDLEIARRKFNAALNDAQSARHSNER